MDEPETPARPRTDVFDEAGVSASVGDVVVAVLVAAGVHEVFGVVGGKLGPLLAAIGRRPDLRWVGTRHEAAAAWMATAVAHGTGRLTACVGELGPGAHNLVGGLLTAAANHLPVLVITSSNPRRFTRPERGMFMAGNTHELLESVTKWSAVVPDADSAVEVTRDAIRRALTGRPGPVHVEVPADVLAMGGAAYMQAASVGCLRWLPSGRAHADPAAVARAAEVIGEAGRILVVGGGVTASGASGELRALVAATGAAATVTQMGIGCVSTGDASFIGHGGMVFGEAPVRAAQEAQVVVAVGCRWSSWTWDGSVPAVSGPPRHDLVQIDIDPAGRHCPSRGPRGHPRDPRQRLLGGDPYGQHRAGFDLSTDLAGTDYAAIARGFGCFGATVGDPADVAPTLDAAASSGLPAVIDVRVRFEPHPAMGRFARLGRS